MWPAAAAPAETALQPWWAARPSSAKANRPVAIDLHAHWVPPTYAKAMADLGRSSLRDSLLIANSASIILASVGKSWPSPLSPGT
jgi:hypothetical protein